MTGSIEQIEQAGDQSGLGLGHQPLGDNAGQCPVKAVFGQVHKGVQKPEKAKEDTASLPVFKVNINIPVQIDGCLRGTHTNTFIYSFICPVGRALAVIYGILGGQSQSSGTDLIGLGVEVEGGLGDELAYDLHILLHKAN